MCKLQDIINKLSNDNLAQNAMVYQVWEDGEITLQKANDLLWQRTLHSMKESINKPMEVVLWPHVYGNYGYAFVTEQDAITIRNKIAKLVIQDINFKINP